MSYDYLESDRLLYRPFEFEDIPTLIKLQNETRYRQWFYFLPLTDTEEATKQVRQSMKIWKGNPDIRKDNFTFAVVRKSDAVFIGAVMLLNFKGEEALNDLELGQYIGEAYQGNGYATEAAKRMVELGLEKLRQGGRAMKIVGIAEHENWGSRRALEKAGFSYMFAEKYCSVYEIRKSVNHHRRLSGNQ